MPWIVPSEKNKWIPEKFGLRVGEDYYGISSPNIAEVIKRVDKAADAGERDADVSGLLDPIDDDGPPPPDRIPVNEQSQAALASLKPFAQGPIEEGADKAEETEQARFASCGTSRGCSSVDAVC